MNDDTENLHDSNPTSDGRIHAESIDDHSTTETDSVAESVVFAVSALTGIDPIELEPLHSVVNVDALEDLFAPKANGTPRGEGTVSFVYGGCDVTVYGTDRVLVELHDGK